MSRRLLILSLPVTTLGLLVVALHSAFVDEGAIGWQFVKIFTSVTLLAANAVALRAIALSSPSYRLSQLAIVGGSLQIATGAAALAWTQHLALVTGDFEGGIAALSALIAGQGFMLITHAAGSQITGWAASKTSQPES